MYRTERNHLTSFLRPNGVSYDPTKYLTIVPFFQINKIAEEMADFLCDRFGMGRPSDGCVNLTISNFRALIGTVIEIYEFDEQVVNLVTKLKGLRSILKKKKDGFVKVMRKCKKNYPAPMFSRFKEDVTLSISNVNGSYFFKSSTLTQISKMISLFPECSERVNKFKNAEEDVKRKGKRTMRVERSSQVLSSECSQYLKRVKFESSIDDVKGVEVVFPVWNKDFPADIKLTFKGT